MVIKLNEIKHLIENIKAFYKDQARSVGHLHFAHIKEILRDIRFSSWSNEFKNRKDVCFRWKYKFLIRKIKDYCRKYK